MCLTVKGSGPLKPANKTRWKVAHVIYRPGDTHLGIPIIKSPFQYDYQWTGVKQKAVYSSRLPLSCDVGFHCFPHERDALEMYSAGKRNTGGSMSQHPMVLLELNVDELNAVGITANVGAGMDGLPCETWLAATIKLVWFEVEENQWIGCPYSTFLDEYAERIDAKNEELSLSKKYR